MKTNAQGLKTSGSLAVGGGPEHCAQREEDGFRVMGTFMVLMGWRCFSGEAIRQVILDGTC